MCIRDSSIDTKKWSTSLSAQLRQRQDDPVPKEVEKQKIVDKPEPLPVQGPPPPPPAKKSEPVKIGFSPIDFGNTAKPIKDINKLDDVIEATSGIHQGETFSIFFMDLLTGNGGRPITNDLEWLKRGVSAYRLKIDGLDPNNTTATPYFPGQVSYINRIVKEYGLSLIHI